MQNNHIKQATYTSTLADQVKTPPNPAIPMQSPSTNSASLCTLPPRRRGDYSKTFRKVDIVSNHFEVSLKNLGKIVIYGLKIEPRIQTDNAVLLKKICSQIGQQVAKKIGIHVFRGFNVFSSQQYDGTLTFKAGEYTVTIKQRKVYEDGSKPSVLRQFLNITFRNIMTQKGYVQIGKTGRYFNLKVSKPIDNLRMFKGYSSSFTELEQSVYLRIQTARKMVRRDSVLEFINSMYARYKHASKDEVRNLVKNQLINKIVLTNYGKANFYLVKDVEYRSATDVFISEKYPNLMVYYQERYGIKIMNERQPLLVVDQKYLRKNKIADQNEEKTYLIPELCLMTGMPPDFDENRRKKISIQTIITAKEKYDQVNGLMTELKKEEVLSDLAKMGILINHSMTEFTGRQINNPSLKLGSKCQIARSKESNFTMYSDPIYDSKHSVRMIIIHNSEYDVKAMRRTFEETSKKLDIELKIKQYDDMFQYGKIEKMIKKAIRKYNQDAKNPYNMVLIVLPSRMKDSYSEIKQYTLDNQKILTQCVLESSLRKKGVQTVHTKLLLQMVAKRGNILWAPSCEGQIKSVLKNVMLVGIDQAVYDKEILIAACGTMNQTFTRHISDTKSIPADKIHQKYQTMTTVVLNCLQAYSHKNKQIPREMIIFMNSCSDDQTNLYQENFSEVLRNRIKDIYDRSVKLTVVMVNLKNSERFFKVTDDVRNVFPGTLISKTIVSKNYDFFIVSQSARNGVSVPNHYKVITCDSDLEEGHLQELIFSQCFNYVNWTGSIKIPAILQYAKKCAKFNADVLKGKSIAKDMLSKLYFI